MSDFTVIGDIGETLKYILDDDPWDGFLSTQKPVVTFKSPKEIKDEPGNADNLISIFLYHIQVNPYLRNEEPINSNDTKQLQPPLALDLFYLVTPYSEDKTDEKYILGKVMQIFNDNCKLYGTALQGGLARTDEEFKLLFSTVSLDNLARVWDAFQEAAYRLSVGYMVPAVRIDSTRVLDIKRVVSSRIDDSHKVPKIEGL